MGVDRRAVHLPRPPPPRHLPRPARVPARALPREARRDVHVDPVRRRRAPLPRRRVRAVRDEGRAADARRALDGCAPSRPSPSASRAARSRSRPAERGRRVVAALDRSGCTRRTRKEQQARRAALLRRPATVFARRGFAAGLDRRGRGRGRLHEGRVLRELREQGGAVPGDARRALRRAGRATRRGARGATSSPRRGRAGGGDDFARYLAADPEWQRLFFEFAAHAARTTSSARSWWRATATLRARIATVIGGAPRRRLRAARPVRADRADAVRDGQRLRDGAPARARRRARRPVRDDARAADSGSDGQGCPGRRPGCSSRDSRWSTSTAEP